MTTKRAGCTQQIAMGFNLLSLRKCLLQDRYHDRLQLWTDTTTIKTDTINLFRIQLRQKFLTENSVYDNPVLMKRIDALGMETLYSA